MRDNAFHHDRSGAVRRDDPLDLGEPAPLPNRPHTDRVGWVTFVVSMILLWGGVVGTARTRFKFAKIFEDFDTELPALTGWVLHVPPIIVAAAAALLTGLLVMAQLKVRDPVARSMVQGYALIAIFIGDVFIALAMMLPLLKVLESVT